MLHRTNNPEPGQAPKQNRSDRGLCLCRLGFTSHPGPKKTRQGRPDRDPYLCTSGAWVVGAGAAKYDWFKSIFVVFFSSSTAASAFSC